MGFPQRNVIEAPNSECKGWQGELFNTARAEQGCEETLLPGLTRTQLQPLARSCPVPRQPGAVGGPCPAAAFSIAALGL